MKKIRAGVVAAFVGAAIATPAGVLTATPAWAAPAPTQASCVNVAQTPVGRIEGTGTRFSCGQAVAVQVVVNRDVSFAPDPTAASASLTFVNGNLTAFGDCRHGSGNYYTEIRIQGNNTDQSERVSAC